MNRQNKTIPQFQPASSDIKGPAISPWIFPLLLFVFLRPLVATSFLAAHEVLGINILELFSILMSYLFIIVVLLRLIRFPVDSISIVILVFCAYCALSVLWGSSLQELTRLTLPASVFFMTRCTVQSVLQVNILLLFAIVGYVVPIIGSTFLILLGKSLAMTVYFTGLDRYSGMYKLIHSLAHSMFVFFPLVLLYFSTDQHPPTRKKSLYWFISFLMLCGIYNMYKTYVRTTWIGLVVFVASYLVGRKNYKLFVAILFTLLCAAFISSSFEIIFFDFIEPITEEKDLSMMGSSRLGIWINVLSEFTHLPVERQLLGLGLRHGGQHGYSLAASHNDFFGLMMSLGILGLVIYLLILSKIFFDICKSCLNRLMKFTYFGFLAAVFFMNLASNSYLSRIELAQYFYFIIGTFYVLRDVSQNIDNPKT